MNNDENGIGLPPPTRPAPSMPECKPARREVPQFMQDTLDRVNAKERKNLETRVMWAACLTLERLGYTWEGGAEWKPPLGKAPNFDMLDAARAEIDELRRQLASYEVRVDASPEFIKHSLARLSADAGQDPSPADAPLETSEDEARPYVAPTFQWEPGVASGQPLDANALERIARQLPDECFLKGSGVLKLTGGIRQLEAQIAELRKGQPAEMSAAARDVLAERRRQQEVEGWTPEHDDRHSGCELAAAAAVYALCTRPDQLRICGVVAWPFKLHWWKPTTYRRNLEKAGALILAEIERLDRAAEKGGAA